MIINNPVLMTVEMIDREYQMTVEAYEQEYQMTAEVTVVMSDGRVYEEYDGSYEIMPTSEPQVLGTSGLVMKEDVVVNPIPSNYGLITWDGANLMVS